VVILSSNCAIYRLSPRTVTKHRCSARILGVCGSSRSRSMRRNPAAYAASDNDSSCELGFANVLTDLALPKPALAVSLVSFNLGVEAGQLAIVAAFLPLAYLSRRSWVYPRLVLGAGSLSIVAVASVWLLERSLDISIFL
jgi:hypothetical protein